jgi:hypothetical protein
VLKTQTSESAPMPAANIRTDFLEDKMCVIFWFFKNLLISLYYLNI